MVGIGKGAERHILIKDAFALENLCKVNCVVLDKTGTLTEGHPSVSDVLWITDSDQTSQSVLLAAEQKIGTSSCNRNYRISERGRVSHRKKSTHSKVLPEKGSKLFSKIVNTG